MIMVVVMMEVTVVVVTMLVVVRVACVRSKVRSVIQFCASPCTATKYNTLLGRVSYF